MPKPKNKPKKSGGRKKQQGRRSPKKSPHSTPNQSNTSSQRSSPKQHLSPAEELKEHGNREFQKNHFDRAVDYYSRSLAIDGNNHAVYANRSAAYVRLKKYTLAIEDANKCLELNPTWAKGYVRKSNIYAAQKKFEKAQEILRGAMEQCPEQLVIKKAMNDLDIKRLNSMDKSDRIVGGHHQQADKFRRMFDWLIENGGKFPKLYLKFYTPEYRAIHATNRISKDEDVMYVPHDCIMTSDVAKASHIGQAIINSGVELRSKHSYLAAYLLQEREKGKESKWFPYLDILPRTFETIPIFFGEERRKLLQGSIALKKIDDRIESLRLEYQSICEHVPEFRRFPHEDFVWARLVVITRIFGLVIDSVKTDGLVPMADMLNHKRPRETKWTYEQKRRGFVVTALQLIKQNAEVFDSYGRKCNSRFFVNYGFSLEVNLDNEALMCFELPKNDPQYAIKARQLGFNAHEHVYREFQIPMQYKEKKVKECFSFLRVAHAQGKEFMIISSDGLRTDDLPPLSVRNETSVLTSLAVAATKSLKKFPNSLEDDNALLADEENYPKLTNKRNIILMRRGEKEVLTFYIHLLRECQQLFRMKPKDLKVKLRKEKRWKRQEDPLVQYVNSVVVPLVTKL